jgi:hypothetical protein
MVGHRRETVCRRLADRVEIVCRPFVGPDKMRPVQRGGVAGAAWIGLVVVVVAVVGRSCSDGGSSASSPGAIDIDDPPPYEMEVTVDAVGRPFDVMMPEGAEISIERAGEIHLPDGKLLVLDGNMLPFQGVVDDSVVTVDLGDAELFEVDAVWIDQDGYRSVAGLVFTVTDEPVVQWSSFETAYGTDGGVGAVTSTEYIRVNASRSIDEQDDLSEDQLDELYADGGSMLFENFDGLPGLDTILFSNGFGDGAFPMTRGKSADRKLAQVVIWHQLVPWRLAFPDAIPPRDVLEQEDELAECLDGKKIDPNTTCKEGSTVPVPLPTTPTTATTAPATTP